LGEHNVLSRKLIKKQRGRRPLTAIAVAGLLSGLLLAGGTALAVHDEQFQLDGDTDPAISQNTPGDPPEDWESLFNPNGTNQAIIDPEAADGFTAGSFQRDFLSKTGKTGTCEESTGTTFCTRDASTFATGSKDTLDIDGWQCNRDNNVNSKIDIMNGYAAQYIDPGTGDRIMYFGLDKNVDNGNNNVGFWFFRGEVGCESPGGSVDFSGEHQDGDVLVVSAFTNGGGVSNITAYQWNGGCIDNPSPQTPAACDGLAIGNGGDCKVAPTGTTDSICATTNSGPNEENDAITTAWLTANAGAVGHTVVPPDFFEGGINLTTVFENAGQQVPSCFSSFLADTRSSQSLTATLFDFAGGELGSCESTLTTDAGNEDNGGIASPSDIGTGSVSSGTDTATLDISGTNAWAGTLTFYLCGPDEDLTSCDRSEGYEVSSAEVDQDSTADKFVSDDVQITSAGTYCWTAHFEPDQDTSDAGVDPADDDGTGECFTVDPVKPTLTTSASCGTSSPCVLGVDTIDDTATLSGTASQPGDNGGNTTYPSIGADNGDPANNSITWNLYGPGDCGGTALFSTSRTVAGDDTYPTALQTAVSYTPSLTDGVGTYTWVASYPGDSPNTSAADTTGCSDTAEQVTLIGSAGLSSAQDWLPNDTVTLTTTGGTTLTGTLTVTLYEGTFTEDSDGCVADEAATAVTDQDYTFTPNGDASGTEYETSNTDFFVTEDNDGDYFWLAVYADDNLTSPSSHCESTSIDVTD
jgi:hypothetical protein